MDIKYRGKRIDNGNWICGGIDIQNGEATIFDHDCICHSGYDVDIETVGKYTEFIDDEGNKIFEGDKIKAYKYGDKESVPFMQEVKFKNGCFMYGNWNWHEFLRVFRYTEVIGNIYENQESENK